MRTLFNLLLVTAVAVAQAPPPATAPKQPAKPAPAPAEPPVIPSLVPPVKDGKVTYPLTLSPAAAPKPLSNYYLEAGYGEKQPGDKLSGFMKCFMEQDNFFKGDNQTKREVWLGTPLDELPDEAMLGGGIAYEPKYANLMVYADQAARYTRTEWNEYFNLRKDGIMFLLPEVQKMRALSQMVKVRMRAEVKRGEFDKAVVSARTLFGLARMLETHPTLIGNLVGLAVAGQAADCLQEMIARPGCPNLFWSFADLPTPFVSIRDGLGGERVFIQVEFHKFVASNKPMTDDEVAAAVAQIDGYIGLSGEKTGPLNTAALRYAALATDAKKVDAARDRLTKTGTPADVVKAMPKLQVMMIEDMHRYEVTRDEVFKWMNRPHPEALDGLTEAEKLTKAERDAGWVLGPAFLPAMNKVKYAQVKLDQRLAVLRAVEGVRLYAHANAGKLPEKLSDLGVPEPLDPVGGKAFTYTVKDGTATLSGKNPTGLESDNRVYELKVRK
jgi:hypothetical protein